MPRIAPIPFEDLNDESRRIIDEGFGEGSYPAEVDSRKPGFVPAGS